jgi:hypothetical protein
MVTYNWGRGTLVLIIITLFSKSQLFFKHHIPRIKGHAKHTKHYEMKI